jgi:drug/metabolite transporter (DMT)-like permease
VSFEALGLGVPWSKAAQIKRPEPFGSTRVDVQCGDIIGSVSDLTIYSIIGIAATLRKWKEFRHQTGQWPVLSIAAALFGITVFVGGVGFLIWYSGQHQWSKNRFALILIAAGLAFVLGWGRVQDKIYLGERRRAR